MKSRMKMKGVIVVMLISFVLIVPFISAGFFESAWNKITGKASDNQNVLLNISVTSGAPTVYAIYNVTSAITLTDAPSPTFVIINFSVTDPDGAVNLNNASAAVNITKGSGMRSNSSCAVKDYSGNYANYTCNVTLWWWDAGGTDWKISANISDLGANIGINDSKFVTVNTLKGFVMTPSALTFASMPAGSTNKTPTNYLLLNNTGNTDIGTSGVQINATDLVGETNAGKFLWAGNFSASIYTGGNIECNITGSATQMVNESYTAVTNTILASGNYTINDGTAQERVYLCLRQVGVELTQQQYSTNTLGSWTVKVV
jgi:hypothetical protein